MPARAYAISTQVGGSSWRLTSSFKAATSSKRRDLRVLTFADLDSEAGVVHVTKAWDYEEAKVKPPKTRNGVRRVPVEPALLPLLDRMRKGKA